MFSVRLALLSAVAVLAAPVLFAQDKLPTYTDAEAKQHVGEEAIVTGLVAGVSTSGKGNTYLNLGAKHPKEVFSGVILAEDAAKVPEPKQYEGKTVALTGKIEIRNDRPQMIVKDPAQIKIIDAAAK